MANRALAFALGTLLMAATGCTTDGNAVPTNPEGKARVASDTRPLVIGHRGASGYRPEHTLASYELAIAQGADFIEPDLVMTKDGVLIARHENEIGGTTDVANKFPGRLSTKTVDGQSITGYFTEDFTLAEIKTLRAKERLETRDHSHDGLYEVPTFREVIELAKRKSRETGREIGIYPETKHPSYHRSVNLVLETAVARELTAAGWTKASDPVIVQSFELSSLETLSKMTGVRLVFLSDVIPESAPFLYGIGPWKRAIVPEVDGKLQRPTDFIERAHAKGLKVHPYTFRSDKEFLAPEYGGDPEAEYKQFYELGVDGLFSDFPDHAVKARNALSK